MHHRLPTRTTWRGLAVGATALLALAAAAPASAHPGPPPRFAEVDQVSDQPGHAKLTDTSVVNAWGLSFTATSPLWVSNNVTGNSTLYAGGVGGATVTKAGLTVAVPGGPTGQAANPGTDFSVTGPVGSGPARFLFVTLSGDVRGWTPAADGTNALLGQHVDGAVFTGMAAISTSFGSFLLAADFRNGRIDVFDGQFRQIPLPPAVFFHDPKLPKGYAPFNVMVSGDKVYVAYAKQGPDGRSAAGRGLGFVDVYTDFGVTVHRLASRDSLNAPWGMAFAPASFGALAGDLLVGNFGDGRINVFDGDHSEGQLRGVDGKPVTIDGLWALLPGTASTGGVDALWFSAGPDHETHGLVGQLTPASTS